LLPAVVQKKFTEFLLLRYDINFLIAGNGLNMMRAASCSISFLWFIYFDVVDSFSLKKERRHELYLLLAAGLFFW